MQGGARVLAIPRGGLPPSGQGPEGVIDRLEPRAPRRAGRLHLRRGACRRGAARRGARILRHTSLPNCASVSSPSAPNNTVPLDQPSSTRAGEDGCTHGEVRLVRHGRLPLKLLLAINQVQELFDRHSFWAQGRSRRALVRMLLGSCSVVSAWQEGELVGIGRATSDGVFRAVLWDVVVAEEHQGKGLGRRIVEDLLSSAPLAACERVYLMTTNSGGFYERLGFSGEHGQQLLVLYSKR